MIKIVIAFMLGFLIAFGLLLSKWVHIETENKLIITQHTFAENCRDICYYQVMGEPYPGSCQEELEAI